MNCDTEHMSGGCGGSPERATPASRDVRGGVARRALRPTFLSLASRVTTRALPKLPSQRHIRPTAANSRRRSRNTRADSRSERHRDPLSSASAGLAMSSGSGGQPSLGGCYLPAFTAMSWCAFASASYSLASAS
jgi:hypothetical protein